MEGAADGDDPGASDFMATEYGAQFTDGGDEGLAAEVHVAGGRDLEQLASSAAPFLPTQTSHLVRELKRKIRLEDKAVAEELARAKVCMCGVGAVLHGGASHRTSRQCMCVFVCGGCTSCSAGSAPPAALTQTELDAAWSVLEASIRRQLTAEAGAELRDASAQLRVTAGAILRCLTNMQEFEAAMRR